MQEINSTVKSLPLHIEVYPTAVSHLGSWNLTEGLEISNFLIDG